MPDQEELLAFLADQPVARLATADAAGQPHVVPFCFALWQGALYTPIDEKPKRSDRPLKRLRNLAENPRVAVVADHYETDWTRLRWVMVQGQASILEGGPERAAALAALRAKYPQYRAMALETRPIIKIVPDRVFGWAASPMPL